VNLDANAAKHRAARAATCLATEPAATPANGTAAASKKRHAANADRWATLNAFVDGVMGQCTEAEVRVWLVLYREVKPGGLARVGMTDIARRTGMTRRAVVNAVNGLKKRRLAEVVTRGSINGSPNCYRLLNAGA
jgi:hypothetical protein